jgi:O-antigen/teichoic acid export membrane protein
MPSLRFDRQRICWQTASSLLSFNMWAVANHLAWFLHDCAPPLLLNHLATPMDVKSLYVPAQADIQIRSFVQTVTVPLLPVLTAMQATDQMQRLRNSFLRACRWSLWLIMYFVVCLVVFREEVMRLFFSNTGRSYPDSGIALGLLLAAYFSYLPRMMLMQVGLALGRVRAITLHNLGSQICNTAIMFCLVAFWGTGAVGVAISTLTVEVVWHVLIWAPLATRLIEVPLSRYAREALLWGAAPALVCGVCCELVRQLAPPLGIVALGLYAAAGLAVYLLVLFGCLTPADRADLRRAWSRLFPAVAKAS